jgi:hypothetical protein
MIRSQSIEPVVGDWYRSHGQLFEVVAIDDADQVIEIQHADGDLEEIEAEDWTTRSCAGSLVQAGQPEDASLAADTREEDAGCMPAAIDELQGLRACALDDLDLFSSSE